MTIKLTILGCGSSGGVPRVGNDWGQCDPANSKNRRRRCSVLLEKSAGTATSRVLIDTSPDMREQMLSNHVQSLDGVWYTHEHADHTHGIDELRAFFLRQRHTVPIWADTATASMLKTRFAYCFETNPGSEYPPIVTLNNLQPGTKVSTSGAGGALEATPFTVSHGSINALGFRVRNTAYTPDVNDIPAESLPHLEGLDLWIIDALRRAPHPSHFSLQESLQWVRHMKPKRAVLTNMHIDMDFATLTNELPDGVVPGFDGMQFEL